MKRQLGSHAKISSVIENDRLSGFGSAAEIISEDLFRVLKEYFVISAPPEIKIEKNGDKYSLFVSAACDGLKPFGKI